MSFDLESCKKKFTDLSGNIVLAEVTTDSTENFNLIVRELKGTKNDYDKIYTEDILPHYPNFIILFANLSFISLRPYLKVDEYDGLFSCSSAFLLFIAFSSSWA